MRFWDFHCDTITECFKKGLPLKKNDLHLDADRARIFDTWMQCYAIWIPDSLRGEPAWDYFEDNFRYFVSQMQENDIAVCEDIHIHDFVSHKQSGLLCVEGGAVLMGDMERLNELYKRGVRLMTLTWNAENELGYGCQSGTGHLKDFGKSVVREMEKLKMIIDVSHLNKTGFYDVLSAVNGPVIASHSTSVEVLKKTRVDSEDKTFSINRALEDDQIRCIAERKGLIGLNFYKSFLGDPGNDGLDALLRHADHILQLGEEDVLAIGSDFDGCEMTEDLSGIENTPKIYDYFAKNGFGKALSDKIFFDNALHFAKSVL